MVEKKLKMILFRKPFFTAEVLKRLSWKVKWNLVNIWVWKKEICLPLFWLIILSHLDYEIMEQNDCPSWAIPTTRFTTAHPILSNRSGFWFHLHQALLGLRVTVWGFSSTCFTHCLLLNVKFSGFTPLGTVGQGNVSTLVVISLELWLYNALLVIFGQCTAGL